MNDKWMDDLKNQLGDYRKDAPEGLLDDIKQEMCRRGVMPNQKVPVKKPVIGYKRQIWWKVAVALKWIVRSKKILMCWLHYIL